MSRRNHCKERGRRLVRRNDVVLRLLPARCLAVASLSPCCCFEFDADARVALRTPSHYYVDFINLYHSLLIHKTTRRAESYCFLSLFYIALFGFLSSSSSSSSAFCFLLLLLSVCGSPCAILLEHGLLLAASVCVQQWVRSRALARAPTAP